MSFYNYNFYLIAMNIETNMINSNINILFLYKLIFKTHMRSLTSFVINEASSEIIDKMKNALREEFNAWYGYIIVKEWLEGTDRKDIEKFYEDTAKDELEDHGYWLMERINQLGGTIEDITESPNSWKSANHKYISPTWKNGNIDIKKEQLKLIVN